VSALPPGSYLSNPDISRVGDDSLPGFDPDSDPVEIRNYEIGVKWDWFGGRLSTTAAAFRTEKHDVPHKVRSNANTFFETGTFYEEQVVQGIELGIAGNLTDRWKVFGGLLLLDSERKSSDEYNYLQCRDRPGDFALGLTTGGCVYGEHTTSGDELA